MLVNCVAYQNGQELAEVAAHEIIVIFPVLQAIESQLEGIEKRIFSEIAPRRNIEDLYALKRKLMVLRHAVRPLVDGVQQSGRRARASAVRRHAGTSVL